jgi:FAD/FMN-containing dehydrogenase
MDGTAAAALLLLLLSGSVAASRHDIYGRSRQMTSTVTSNYTAAYQSLSCSPGVQETPATTQEVADIITKLYATAQAGTPVTLRVSRPNFHSTASFVCPIASVGSLNASQANTTGPASTAAATEVGMLQTKLNKVLAVDPVKSTMRVGSGMTIYELLKEATKNNMSLQVGAAAVRGAGGGGRWNLCLESRAGGIVVSPCMVPSLYSMHGQHEWTRLN